MIEKMYTIREVGEIIRQGRNEVNRMVHQGFFPGAFKGGRGLKTSPILIPESAVKAYLDKLPRVGDEGR